MEAQTPEAKARRYQQVYKTKIPAEMLPRYLAVQMIFLELGNAVRGGLVSLDEANALIEAEYERIAEKVEAENSPDIILWPEERF